MQCYRDKLQSDIFGISSTIKASFAASRPVGILLLVETVSLSESGIIYKNLKFKFIFVQNLLTIFYPFNLPYQQCV